MYIQRPEHTCPFKFKEVYYVCASTSWFQLYYSLMVMLSIHVLIVVHVRFETFYFSMIYLSQLFMIVFLIHYLISVLFKIEKHLVQCKNRGCEWTLNKWKLIQNVHGYLIRILYILISDLIFDFLFLNEQTYNVYLNYI